MTNISELLSFPFAGGQSLGWNEDRVDDLYPAPGVRKARAIRAKGIMLEGEFTPAENAAGLGGASIFCGETLPVTARFSDFAGFRDDFDTHPRGLAVTFRPRLGPQADVVSHSFNGFPTRRTAEFSFGPRHARTGGGQAPAPQSYATCAYYGVDTMALSRADRRLMFIRSHFVPAAGEHFLTPGEIAARGHDYLREEMMERLRAGPVVFYFVGEIATPGGDIADPSAAWPEGGPLAVLGTITLRGVSPGPAGADGALPVMPDTLADAVMAARSPLLRRDAGRPFAGQWQPG